MCRVWLRFTASQLGESVPIRGVESCCIALHVPGVDPVVRANWEQFVIPFSGVHVGRRGGRTATGRPREWAIKWPVFD